LEREEDVGGKKKRKKQQQKRKPKGQKKGAPIIRERGGEKGGEIMGKKKPSGATRGRGEKHVLKEATNNLSGNLGKKANNGGVGFSSL